jgi:putative ABC transport system permease protein
MAVWGDWNPSLTPNDGGLPEILPGAICSYGLFATLGAQPALGRTFLAEDDRKEIERVVIIGDALWRRRFGAKPDVVGAKMRLDGQLHTVIGVMPAGFDFPNAETQAWVPVWQILTENEKRGRGNHRFNVAARLNPGIPLEQARAELDGIARRIRAQYPESVTGAGANVVLLQERMVARVRPLLLVLFGAVACVLMIACVNVTNLLLGRWSGEGKSP